MGSALHIFVTGAAGGIGRAIVRRCLRAGHKVTATDRDEPALRRAFGPRPVDRLRLERVDVRDDRSVAAGVAAAAAWAGIDVLVNAAGVAWFVPQEDGDAARFADLLDVNVVGAHRVTRAALPHLVERAGVIVQISSVAGRVTFPGSGFYAASKHALEALSEALAEEVGPLGVRVRVIEPGSFDTGLQAAAVAYAGDPRPSRYDAAQAGWAEDRQRVLAPPQDPADVADALLRGLADPEPFLRVPVGADARAALPVEASTALAALLRRQDQAETG